MVHYRVKYFTTKATYLKYEQNASVKYFKLKYIQYLIKFTSEQKNWYFVTMSNAGAEKKTSPQLGLDITILINV